MISSYGTVHKAVHKPTADIVALKIIPVENEQTELQELMKEIEILRKCNSAYIVNYKGSYLYNSQMWVRKTAYGCECKF